MAALEEHCNFINLAFILNFLPLYPPQQSSIENSGISDPVVRAHSQQDSAHQEELLELEMFPAFQGHTHSTGLKQGTISS